MSAAQPIRLPPDVPMRSVRRQRKPDDYTIREKKQIALAVVTPGARIECPRCDHDLEMVGVPAAGGGTIEVVWDFQCDGCKRRVLLTNLPDRAKAS